MKKTNERIFKQHAALVDVIQWLDANGHSNEPIRETVDRVLNYSRNKILLMLWGLFLVNCSVDIFYKTNNFYDVCMDEQTARFFLNLCCVLKAI